MIVDDFLTKNKPILKVMAINGISLDLGRCAGMVELYEREKAKHGSKYAVEYCKREFAIKTEANFWRVLKELKRPLL